MAQSSCQVLVRNVHVFALLSTPESRRSTDNSSTRGPWCARNADFQRPSFWKFSTQGLPLLLASIHTIILLALTTFTSLLHASPRSCSIKPTTWPTNKQEQASDKSPRTGRHVQPVTGLMAVSRPVFVQRSNGNHRLATVSSGLELARLCEITCDGPDAVVVCSHGDA